MNLDAIPTELRERHQWLLWRGEERDGKLTKVPYRAGGSKASTTDPSTWSSFEQAVDALRAAGPNMDGIGFVFSPDDPFAGADLDVLNPDTAAIMAALDSYTERSVSGNGFHVIVRASLNGHPRHRTGPIEIYSEGRYFVVTGDHVVGTPTSIEERQAQLDEILERFLPQPKPREPRRPSQPVDVDDRELLDKAFVARNGADFQRLWNGDTSGHGDDRSAADLALCSHLRFWTGADPARIDMLFRRSGLMREKWDSRRGDSTYGAQTIARALETGGDVYAPDQRYGVSATEARPPARALEPPKTRLTLRGLDTYSIRRVQWLDKPFLQRAAFTLWAGRKGVLKGTINCSIAARVSNGELYGEPKRVLVVTSEDSIELDFKPRVVAAGGDETQIKIVHGDFRMPADLFWLQSCAKELGDVGLIVIDPIGNHLGGADTDKEGLVRHGIAPLNPMADELDCMIFGVRHLGKDVSRGALASVLGSTAWVDVPRCVILLAREDEDDMLFHAQVVAGNRGPRNSGRAYRLKLVDVPPATEITFAELEGESTKDVEDLLGVQRSDKPTSRSAEASELLLDILDGEGPQESDALDARVAQQTGIAAKTVRNLRSKLKNDGLIHIYPSKDETGAIDRWMVSRTLAPRHPGLKP